MAEQKRNIRTSRSKTPQPVTDYGRIQPQAPELEEAVLGALMIEKDAYSLVSEILRPESFYEHRHQLIYAAITDLAVNQKPASRSSRKSSRSRAKTVVIRRGDTLSTIAKRHGTTVSKLKRLNGIKGTSIRAGKRIRVR